MIHREVLESRQAGLDREEIQWADFQDAIAQAAYNSSASESTSGLPLVV